MTPREHLIALASIEGYRDVEEMLCDAAFDDVVPGICKNAECSYTTGTEPDATANWCEICNTNSVVSCLVLAGVI